MGDATPLKGRREDRDPNRGVIRLGDVDRERIASSGRRVASSYPPDLPESRDEGAIPTGGHGRAVRDLLA